MVALPEPSTSARNDPRGPAPRDAHLTTTRGWRQVTAAYLGAALLVALVVEPAVLRRIAIHDYHNFDLGIYSQALYRLSLSDLNPWLTVRETKIFNDHFDPILLLVAPAAKIFEPATVAVIAELLFVLASPLPFVWLFRAGRLSASVTALGIVVLLWNRGVGNALQFPAHPTTWAILPMSALAAAIALDRRWWVLLTCTALFLFKEEFPFVGLMVAAIYLARREYRFALLIGAWSLFWIVGVFSFRPWIVGPVHHHAADRFVSFGQPLEGVKLALEGLVSRPVLHAALPLVPLMVWIAWGRHRASTPLLLLIVPLVAIRLLGRAWGAHYLAPLMPVLIVGLLPIGSSIKVPRWVMLSTLVVLVSISFGPWKRSVELLAWPTMGPPRPPAPERLASIESGRQYLLAHQEGKALVQGNLIPLLVRRAELYQVAGSHNPAEHTFRYTFIEKPPFGDPWPVEYEDYRQLLAQWRSAPHTRVILDDAHVWLAEGVFHDRPR